MLHHRRNKQKVQKERSARSKVLFMAPAKQKKKTGSNPDYSGMERNPDVAPAPYKVRHNNPPRPYHRKAFRVVFDDLG